MAESPNYAVFLFPQALEALGDPVKPYVRDAPMGPHIVCAEIDASGSAYVVGSTSSLDFPTQNPLQPAFAGGPNDGFITKLNPSGSSLVYSTYLGGSDADFIQAVAVNSAGNAYLAGYTTSANFPVANAPEPSVAAAAIAEVAISSTTYKTVEIPTVFDLKKMGLTYFPQRG